MPAQQHFKRLISADSHVMEPLDLWWKALGQKFGERTPRYLNAYQGQPGNFFYTGYQGWPVGWLRDNRPRRKAPRWRPPPEAWRRAATIPRYGCNSSNRQELRPRCSTRPG